MAKRKHAEISKTGKGSPDSHDAPDSAYGTQSPAIAESPFTVEYPGRPSKNGKVKKRKGAKSSDDQTPEKTEQDVPAKDLELIYTIRPGTLWESMKKYRNFVGKPATFWYEIVVRLLISAVGEETFGVNDFVSVNHSNIAHGADLTTEDEKMFWIAQVLEVRALDSQHVYLRVFWSYWPDELPGGAKDYHGKHELVVSNFMEIIDAMTVAGKAEVCHWLEKDEEPVLDGLYWRQTYNFHTQALSVRAPLLQNPSTP